MRALAALIFLASALAQADAVVELDNGFTFLVPKGWHVEVIPDGYNTGRYDASTNPKGKLPGWGGHPGYKQYLDTLGCGGDNLVISPNYCPPGPSVLDFKACYFEPPPPPKCEGLVISPGYCIK